MLKSRQPYSSKEIVDFALKGELSTEIVYRWIRWGQSRVEGRSRFETAPAIVAQEYEVERLARRRHLQIALLLAAVAIGIAFVDTSLLLTEIGKKFIYYAVAGNLIGVMISFFIAPADPSTQENGFGTALRELEAMPCHGVTKWHFMTAPELEQSVTESLSLIASWIIRERRSSEDEAQVNCEKYHLQFADALEIFKKFGLICEGAQTKRYFDLAEKMVAESDKRYSILMNKDRYNDFEEQEGE